MTYSTTNPAQLSSTHQASLLTLLTHRLEAAKARHDQQLVTALENEYAQLTAIAQPATTVDNRLQHRLQQLWMSFAETLSEWNKVHIQQVVDANGQHSWYAYNPQAGQSLNTGSPDELRQWLKQTYWEK